MIKNIIVYFLREYLDKQCYSDKHDGCADCFWYDDELGVCYLARAIDRFDYYRGY